MPKDDLAPRELQDIPCLYIAGQTIEIDKK